MYQHDKLEEFINSISDHPYCTIKQINGNKHVAYFEDDISVNFSWTGFDQPDFLIALAKKIIEYYHIIKR
jgi:hypothetical protein